MYLNVRKCVCRVFPQHLSMYLERRSRLFCRLTSLFVWKLPCAVVLYWTYREYRDLSFTEVCVSIIQPMPILQQVMGPVSTLSARISEKWVIFLKCWMDCEIVWSELRRAASPRPAHWTKQAKWMKCFKWSQMTAEENQEASGRVENQWEYPEWKVKLENQNTQVVQCTQIWRKVRSVPLSLECEPEMQVNILRYINWICEYHLMTVRKESEWKFCVKWKWLS